MNTLDRSLRAYSMVALAAGVGITALSQPAEARVVITTNINIPIGHPTSIDLNKDGIPDVYFSAFSTEPSGNVNHDNLYVRGALGNGIEANNGSALALVRSAKIGASQQFSSGGWMLETNCTSGVVCTFRGKWKGVPANRFIGAKFLIKGQTHYGWIRVTVKSALNATITEYGYETIAGKSLKAGLKSNNASLGELAAGVDGLSNWRK